MFGKNEGENVYLSMGQVCKILDVSRLTVIAWIKKGKLNCKIMPNGYRAFISNEIYELANIQKIDETVKKTLCYVRVVSIEQSDLLDSQAQTLSTYCSNNKWLHEIIRDYGSGLDYDKKGIRKLIDKFFTKEYERLVITHKDVLARFGYEFIFAICERLNIEVIVLNSPQTILNIEDDFKTDLSEVLKVFNKRLYGDISPKIKKSLLDIEGIVNTFLINDDIL